MSKFTVDLTEPSPPKVEILTPLGEHPAPAKPGRWKKVLGITAAIFGVIMLIGGIAGYFYWQSVKKTPQYSLALLVDAARRDDQKTIDEVVNMNAVVDDFLPQITGKAAELYGRGMSPETISRLTQIAQPLLPAVKDRAREALPKMIRDKTEKYQNIPFWAMAIGAERYMDITIEGDIAYVKSKIPERALEVKMRKNGDKWQIVGVKDEELATKIAQRVGQGIIALATNSGTTPSGERIGIKSLQDMLRRAQELLEEQ